MEASKVVFETIIVNIVDAKLIDSNMNIHLFLNCTFFNEP